MLLTFKEIEYMTDALETEKFEIAALGRASGFDSVSIDSRNSKQGSLFAALSGENTDGHKFVENAFNLGASAALVEKSKLAEFSLKDLAAKKNCTLIAVDNTLHGLQNLAAMYVQKFPNLLRIGITGSSGKTTTKEITAAIFKNEKNIAYNEGNLNSETGLPLSVFSITSGHTAGIFEMGMNRHGEIAELAKVLKPQIACITNTGSAHVGHIGSTEKIALEKKDIFSMFTGRETAIIPEDSAYKELLSKDVNGKIKYFGIGTFTKNGGKKNSLGLLGSELNLNGKKIHFSLPGEHNFKNVLAAIAIAQEAGISNDSIAKGIENTPSLFGRCEYVSGKASLVKDCYNANPDSMREAITLCDSIQCSGKKIYVIGSMLELGNKTEIEHQNTGNLLEKSNCDFIFLFGNETLCTGQKLKSKKYFWTNNIEELKAELEKKVADGDLVLLKGSRICELERIIGSWAEV
ncbi:MAG: UDP-N-acetylmuramoyl-tripeptide--D-alanyl-D-alanine ligase [Termitinemataceae bacterium]|nr:MAG: UDP-N-acetylmuramoyl-tripeptide--D-alanyl-D-alanine ligase [Termitinemataceae bacterium]